MFIVEKVDCIIEIQRDNEVFVPVLCSSYS